MTDSNSYGSRKNRRRKANIQRLIQSTKAEGIAKSYKQKIDAMMPDVPELINRREDLLRVRQEGKWWNERKQAVLDDINNRLIDLKHMIEFVKKFESPYKDA